MAIAASLFNGSIVQVARQLGLSQVPPDGDRWKQIVAGVEKARLEMWKRLGKEALASIVSAVPEAPADPQSDDEYRRALAGTLEVDLVRWHLSNYLALNWRGMDANARAEWNSIDFMRGMTADQVEKYRERIRQECDDAFAKLKNPDGTGFGEAADVFVIDSGYSPTIGDSIAPGGGSGVVCWSS